MRCESADFIGTRSSAICCNKAEYKAATEPFVLVNGKMIKSVKRLCWINDYLHKVSRFIINYALMADAGTLVIGHNFEWKKSINIGKLNNQKFVSIPHARLIEMIQYKADENRAHCDCKRGKLHQQSERFGL